MIPCSKKECYPKNLPHCILNSYAFKSFHEPEIENWFEGTLLTVDMSLTYNYIRFRTRQYFELYYTSFEKGLIDEQFAVFHEKI